MFALDLKLLFSFFNFCDDLTGLCNWNIANGMVTNFFKTVYLKRCENITFEFENCLKNNNVKFKKTYE